MNTVVNLDKKKKKDLKLELKKSYMLALKDNNFVKLVNSLDVSEDVLIKNTSKLESTVSELNKCAGCKGLHMCKNQVYGHVYYPKSEDDYLVFGYKPCKYTKENEKEENHVSFFETPVSLRNAKMSEIEIDDKNRIEVIKYIKDFINNFESDKKKGVYLHGSFGSGKSYLISALLNEMSKKGYNCVNVYYPLILKKLKDSFDDDFGSVLDEIMQSDILLIDDIGAENNTSWGRDEVLGTILQYRMDNDLSTFFTSNFNLSELEEHLKNTSKSIDDIKARRIIERIKQLTVQIELVSKNKRK